MQSTANSIEQYINELPDDRKEAITKLHKIIKKNLPKGFTACMNYGMIGYVVPHSLYPPGYHCDPKLPLPFMALASQKNFIAVYSMTVYGSSEIYDWFTQEHAKQSTKKLDMGKSCIRYKKPEDIPYNLIGELAAKVTVQEWIDTYEKAYVKKK